MMNMKDVKEKVANWFLGDLPPNYPRERLEGPQGLKDLKAQLKDETRRETLGGRVVPAYPAGIIVRLVRRAILWARVARIEFWVDQLRDWMAFTVLARKSRTIEEIATWRDHYFLLQFGYFIVALWLFPSLPSALTTVFYVLSGLFLLDMLGALAGCALVWYEKSVSHERTFVLSLMNYAEVIVAFAGFYRACGCLNAPNPDMLQALYFSTVVATTLGFGDILPLNSTGLDARGCQVPVGHWGLLLVVGELAFTVLLVLVFVTTFLARSMNPTSTKREGTPAEHGDDAPRT